MKHRAICDECDNNDGSSIVWSTGDVQSQLIAVCSCPHGHVTVYGLMHDQFDVLYTSAVFAFIGSFYSESILSFTAALERAYEQYIKLYLAKQLLSFELIDKFWKEIENQSERQYGAFCSAYIATEQKNWTSEQEQVKFRNRVIHKGYICDPNEATRYAEYVTRKLSDIMRSMKLNFADQKIPLYFHIKGSSKNAIQRAMNEHAGANFVATSGPSLLK